MRYQGNGKWLRVFGKRNGHNWTKAFNSIKEFCEWSGYSYYQVHKWMEEARHRGIARNGMSFHVKSY